MRLVTFRAAGERRAGALLDGDVVDLNRADPELPNDVLALLQGGEAALERARRAVGGAGSKAGAVRAVSEVELLAPIPRPPKIVCVGLNYTDHAAEAGLPIRGRPSFFLKAASTVIGTRQPIVRPPTTQ